MGPAAASPLLPRVAAGDREAMQRCLDQYAPLVWSMARNWMRDDARAEDAVQEVFIRVWRTAARYDAARGTERTWIATIARRVLIDETRRGDSASAHEPLEESSASVPSAGLERAAASEEAAAALGVLDTLRPEHKKLLVLSLLHGLSHAQIATKTGLPLGTVKTHLRRGLERLRERLSSIGVTAAGEVMP